MSQLLLRKDEIELVRYERSEIRVWLKSGRGLYRYTAGNDKEYSELVQLLAIPSPFIPVSFYKLCTEQEVKEWQS